MGVTGIEVFPGLLRREKRAAGCGADWAAEVGGERRQRALYTSLTGCSSILRAGRSRWCLLSRGVHAQSGVSRTGKVTLSPGQQAVSDLEAEDSGERGESQSAISCCDLQL